MPAAKVVVEMTPEEFKAYEAGKKAPVVKKNSPAAKKKSPAAKKKSPGRPRKTSPKPCPEGKVRHLKTGRCRKIRPKSPPKPCPEGKERNPKTGRCKRSLEEIAADVLKKKERSANKKADGEKRPLNDYQQHMKDTIARLKLKEERGQMEPMTYRDRFKVAVQAWRERK